MKRYLIGRIHKDTLAHGTEKAFYVTVDDGRWNTGREGHLWIPRSACEVREANDLGWCEILVPLWLFDKNRVDYHRVREITFGIDGKGLIVCQQNQPPAPEATRAERGKQ